MSHCHKPRVRISGGFVLLAAWFALESGWQPLAMVLLAAAAHELGHLLALWALDVPVEGLRITLLGAVLDICGGGLSYGGELLAALAGPLANIFWALALLGAAERFPACYAWGGAHLVLAAFNLLPVRPLDGGRAVEALAIWLLGPAAGERCAGALSGLCAALAAAGLLLLMNRSGGNLWLLPPAAGLLCAAVGELRNGFAGNSLPPWGRGGKRTVQRAERHDTSA